MDNKYLELVNNVANNPFYITNIENPGEDLMKISLKKSNGKTYPVLSARTENIMEFMSDNFSKEYNIALRNKKFMEEEYTKFPKAILNKMSPSKKEIRYVLKQSPEIIEEFDNPHFGKLFCDSFKNDELLPEKSLQKIHEKKLYRDYGGYIKFMNVKDRVKHLYQALKTEPDVITYNFGKKLSKKALKIAFRKKPELILKFDLKNIPDYYLICAINKNPDLITELSKKIEFSITVRWFILCHYLAYFLDLPDITNDEIKYILGRVPQAIANLKNKLSYEEQINFIKTNPEFASHFINKISAEEQINILTENPFLYTLINKPNHKVNQFMNSLSMEIKNDTWTEYFKSFLY